MATKRTVEIFSAGCPACEETVRLVNRVACPSCEVTVLDMHNPEVARRAKSLGVRCSLRKAAPFSPSMRRFGCRWTP